MGTKRNVHQPVRSTLPEDFPERLENFRAAARLSVKALARLLGVRPYRLREWRRGTVPSGAHLFLLLTLAEELGLRDGILMCPKRDLPKGADLEALRQRGA